MVKKKECFTCGASVPKTDQQRIAYYKELEQQTGEKYVYFRNDKGGISITKAKGFKAQGREYALVSEFGNVPATDVVETAQGTSDASEPGTDSSEV